MVRYCRHSVHLLGDCRPSVHRPSVHRPSVHHHSVHRPSVWFPLPIGHFDGIFVDPYDSQDLRQEEV